MALGIQFGGVLEAARLGAEWAVAALYSDLQPAVLGYLRGQEWEAAEDIASEAWIGVARGLDRFAGGEEDFRKWVFAIARRRLIDHRRSRRRAEPVDPQRLPHGGSVDPESLAIDRLAVQEILRLIATLPRDQSEVLLLKVLGGFTAPEIADITGKRAGTVRVLQHRALARLAMSLPKEDVTTEASLSMYWV